MCIDTNAQRLSLRPICVSLIRSRDCHTSSFYIMDSGSFGLRSTRYKWPRTFNYPISVPSTIWFFWVLGRNLVGGSLYSRSNLKKAFKVRRFWQLFWLLSNYSSVHNTRSPKNSHFYTLVPSEVKYWNAPIRYLLISLGSDFQKNMHSPNSHKRFGCIQNDQTIFKNVAFSLKFLIVNKKVFLILQKLRDQNSYFVFVHMTFLTFQKKIIYCLDTHIVNFIGHRTNYWILQILWEKKFSDRSPVFELHMVKLKKKKYMQVNLFDITINP